MNKEIMKTFDKLLKKDNYSKKEVKEIMLSMLEGFGAGTLKALQERKFIPTKEEIEFLRLQLKELNLTKNVINSFKEEKFYKLLGFEIPLSGVIQRIEQRIKQLEGK